MKLIRRLITRFRSVQSQPPAPTELADAAHALRFVDRTAEDRLLTRDRVHAYSDSFQRRY